MSLSILERLCAFDDGSCISLVLEKLSVRDLVQSGGACTVMNKAACQELKRRADEWKQEVSLGWSVCKNEEGKHVYAYEVPFIRARGALNAYFKRISPTKDILLESIASWSGGWSCFLHARETRAREQPNFEHRSRVPAEEVTTLGQGDRSVWIYDIKCEGKWQASAILPRGCAFNGFPCNLLEEVPFFQSLGDEIAERTCFNYNMQQNSKWFLSTDASDARTWTINVSIVSQTCSETLFVSNSIIPRERIEEVDRSGSWEEYSFAGIENANKYLDKESLVANDGNNDHFHEMAMARGGFVYHERVHTALYARLDRRPLHPERFHVMFCKALHENTMQNLILQPPLRTKRVGSALGHEDGKKAKKYFPIFYKN